MLTPLIPAQATPAPSSPAFGAWPFLGAQSLSNPLTLINGATLTAAGPTSSVQVGASGITVTEAGASGGVVVAPGSTATPLVKFGIVNLTFNGSGVATLLFPAPFPTSCDAIILTPSGTGVSFTMNFESGSVSASGVNVEMYQAGSHWTSAATFSYLAIGH